MKTMYSGRLLLTGSALILALFLFRDFFDFHQSEFPSKYRGGSDALPGERNQNNEFNSTESGQHRPPSQRSVEVTDTEIADEIAKDAVLRGMVSSTIPEEIKFCQDLAREKAILRKSGKSAKFISKRGLFTQFTRQPTPLTPNKVVEAFVQSNNSPGAYVAAAGASRDPTWLKIGLEAFPNDATLLTASVLFDWKYLSDPSMVSALKSADQESGWASILEADIALGRQDPKSAYLSIRDATEKSLPLEPLAEINTFLLETGSAPGQNFRDIGNNGSILDRMSQEFLEAAEKAPKDGNSVDRNYYAAAALSLADVRTGSELSEVSSSAARAALLALEFLGPEGSVTFLKGQTYEEARSSYTEIAHSGKIASEAAMAYRATLTGEAVTSFDLLIDRHSFAKALELAKKP